MPVNADKPHLWKQDIAASVDLFNTWFMKFAPKAYRNTRLKVTRQVENALLLTDDLRGLNVALLQSQPQILPTLHMCTCPLLARDRLIGLANSAATPGRPSDQFKAWCTRKLKDRQRPTWPAGHGRPHQLVG